MYWSGSLGGLLTNKHPQVLGAVAAWIYFWLMELLLRDDVSLHIDDNDRSATKVGIRLRGP